MMQRAIFPETVEPDQFAGREMRIPDTPTLLAVLAARQRTLPTVVAMDGDRTPIGPESADRMLRLLVGPGKGGMAASGAFNLGIARFLQGTDQREQGEGGVYRGA